MSRLRIGLWGGLAGVTFGALQSIFPAEWGGRLGLLAVVVIVIPTLAYTVEYLRGRNVR